MPRRFELRPDVAVQHHGENPDDDHEMIDAGPDHPSRRDRGIADAVGDVVGFPALASTSMEQGRLASCHAFGEPTHSITEIQPIGIYSIPEVSYVGATEVDRRADGGDVAGSDAGGDAAAALATEGSGGAASVPSLERRLPT